MNTHDDHRPNRGAERRSAALAAHQDPPDHVPSRSARSAHDDRPIARNLPAAEVAAFLRSLVGLPPSDGEGAVEPSRPAPRTVDVSAWIGWALAGLYACGLPAERGEDDGEARRSGPWVPPIRVVMAEARRVAIVIAMHRHGGNVSHAAEALGTSRRALREALKKAGLYPWGGASATAEDDDDSGHDGHDDDASTTTPDDVKGGE